jgi:hypothetical protein
LFDGLSTKKSEEAINAAALKRVEELEKARFELSRSRVTMAFLAPIAFVILGTVYSEFRHWIFFSLALFASVVAALIFRKDRAIVRSPHAVAAKVTRVVRLPRTGRGYIIHYVFLAEDRTGHTGSWRASIEEGRNYSSGMLVPVLYNGLNPDRNRAWGALSYYRIV